ncbi:MAG: hypothetical protein JWR42_1732, partial [Marmoricola sp.]|nr:hypothetical protein [Marmoricola sp.]
MAAFTGRWAPGTTTVTPMLTGPSGTPSAPVRGAAALAVPLALLLGAGC